jgi:hypothetical protein
MVEIGVVGEELTIAGVTYGRPFYQEIVDWYKFSDWLHAFIVSSLTPIQITNDHVSVMPDTK